MAQTNLGQGLAKALALAGVAVTLVISPWGIYDPINLPKLCVMIPFAFVSLTLSFVILMNRGFQQFDKIAMISLALFGAFLSINSVFLSGNIAQSIWGAWGRNTGAVAYFCLSAILVGCSLLQPKDATLIFRYFSRLSYFVSAYTFLQYLGLDPIAWGQQLPFATLGNINFMSSFLGMATAFFIAKVVFEKQTFTARIHYVFFSLFNFFLILQSGSIQGIGILIAAVCVVTISYYWERRNRFMFATVAFFSVSTGLVVVMGVAGWGPLGRQLIQQTVLYRFDYWGAGWEMFKSSPIWGLGMDSYGDFYREFRGEIATQRTGPARVANTAHNVFLDLMSGGGLLGVSFLVLAFLVTFVWLIKRIANRTATPESYQMLPVVLGFFLFCLISINQLGVGVWGYIFLGTTLALLREDRVKEKLEKRPDSRISPSNSKESLRSIPVKRAKSVVFCGLAISIIATVGAVQQIRIDSGFLKAYKGTDIGLMTKYINAFAPTGFYEDKLLVLLTSKGLDSEALAVAERVIERDRRQFTAWSVVAYSSVASMSRRVEAKNALLKLDPFNRQLADELSAMGL